MEQKPGKPSIAARAAQKVCPECGGPVERKSKKGPRPIFCCEAHKVAFQNRMIVRGRVLAPFVMGWRIDRGSGEIAKEAFSQLCSIVDRFNAEDAKAGRPRADLYAAKLMGSGFQYIDRKRP